MTISPRLSVRNVAAAPLITAMGSVVDDFARANSKLRIQLDQAPHLFYDIARDLVAHVAFEESVLIPYWKRLDAAQQERAPWPTVFGYTAYAVIPRLSADHDRYVRVVADMPELPASLAAALHDHVHLMQNTIFPRIIDLEALRASSCSFEQRFLYSRIHSRRLCPKL
jgi:hypothetical protein